MEARLLIKEPIFLRFHSNSVEFGIRKVYNNYTSETSPESFSLWSALHSQDRIRDSEAFNPVSENFVCYTLSFMYRYVPMNLCDGDETYISIESRY